jgi:aminoglycoside 6'-N-acetyltransferase
MAGPARALTGARVVLEPMADEHHAALLAIHREPAVLEFWGDPDPDFPVDEPTSTRFAIVVDGEVAGLIQYYEETEPASRHAGLDIFVDPRRHNQGIGADAIRTLVEHLFTEVGHHRLVIDPEVRNAAAIRCYAKAGFEPVGVERQSFFIDGAWRDCLLMDRLRV